ncbi:serpin family protein [Inconstantimicrobium mannanitabidum]|uniref:Serine proteinase inhibitor n=1 Tax=Inconstantimicrobium mannanitabidum TaxID=1604901 RepID=A0ACB5RFT1_9CLOT|nr:serpin family protein [Clostridium sp. TW13]GKX67939.1 serine proteinase inhibitor [Clostridium sp. TW13]
MVKINFRIAKFWIIPAVVAVVAIIFFVWIFSKENTLNVSAQDLMKGVNHNKVDTVKLKDEFLKSTTDFSVDLFKQSYDKNENSLVSPTSVYLALGMTANGADGNTLKEFQKLLGKYGLNTKDLNSYYKTLAENLTKVNAGKVSISNSIWYNDDKTIDIKKDFLQTNADYYNASLYKSNFKSSEIVNDINNWVKFNTGKKIDKIVETVDPKTVMYLINTIYFEEKWENIYETKDVHEGSFQLADGKRKSASFMHSAEIGYLSDNMGEGFIKHYKDGKYSFMALLPKENISIESYVNSLSGESFNKLLKNKADEMVVAELPKFKAEYSVRLITTLQKMGLNDCFSIEKANFAPMGSSKQGNIYIEDVLHKTFISVDTEGTKAAAATKVEMKSGAAPSKHFIKLNCPFVYAIIDNETNLPIFIGTMMNPE